MRGVYLEGMGVVLAMGRNREQLLYLELGDDKEVDDLQDAERIEYQEG